MIPSPMLKESAAERLWLPTKLQSTQQADVYLATNFLKEIPQRRGSPKAAGSSSGPLGGWPYANRKHDQDARGLPVHYGLSVRLELSSLLEATYRLLLQEWGPARRSRHYVARTRMEDGCVTTRPMRTRIRWRRISPSMDPPKKPLFGSIINPLKRCPKSSKAASKKRMVR